MPEIDGIQTVRRIRQIDSEHNRAPTQEIIITGFLDPLAEQEAQGLGITTYVYKPFAIAEFLKVVNEKLHVGTN